MLIQDMKILFEKNLFELTGLWLIIEYILCMLIASKHRHWSETQA